MVLLASMLTGCVVVPAYNDYDDYNGHYGYEHGHWHGHGYGHEHRHGYGDDD